MDHSVFCQKPLGDIPTVKLRDKGCESVNKASEERHCNIHVTTGQEVHIDCRRDFVHKRCSTRSLNVFDFKNKCIFCSKDAKINHRKRSQDVFPVRILPFQKSIEHVCIARNDQWAHDVSGRIASIIDLPAADALYHQSCSVNFRTKRQIPKAFQSDVSPCKIQKSPGRPEAIDTNEAFKIVISY